MLERENKFAEQARAINGFPDGGPVFIDSFVTTYSICFEYEDEQNNDCSTITLATGEEKICIVKNYICSRGSGD